MRDFLLPLSTAAALAAPLLAQNVLYDVSGPPWSTVESIGACGDVDGDGYPDFVVGAPLDGGSATGAGAVRVCSGPTGVPIYELYGGHENDALGQCVDGAGDVNADGFPDILAGSSVSGNVARVWSGADGSLLYDLTSTGFDSFGAAVTGLGDVGHDGFDDFAVSATHVYVSSPGSVRIFSGKTGSVLVDLPASCPTSEFGRCIDGLGDVNGDGGVDLAIYEASPGCNQVHVVSLTGPGFTIPVPPPTAVQLNSAAGAGDIDGDGLPDILIGNTGSTSCSGSSPGNVKAYSGATGAVLLDIDGEPGCTWLGWALDGFGDLNADGREDIAAGAAGPNRIDVYSGADASVLVSFESPTGANYGYGVVGLGDVDGDGSLEVGGVGVGDGAWVYSTCPGEVVAYGAGCPGTGGFVPKLTTTGCPNPAQPMVLHIVDGYGGQPAFLAVGTGPGMIPLSGACDLLIAPPWIVVPLGILFNFGPGWGYRDVPLNLPPDTAGLTLVFQEANLDPSSGNGFAVSNGVRLEIR